MEIFYLIFKGKSSKLIDEVLKWQKLYVLSSKKYIITHAELE